MQIKTQIKASLTLIVLLFTSAFTTYAADTEVISVSLAVLPIDATNFQQDFTDPKGDDNCKMTWIPSASPGIDEQEVVVSGPGFPTTSFTLGPAETSLNIGGLIIGETYTMYHFSHSGPYGSNGVANFCVPQAALPKPIIDSGLSDAQLTTSTIYYTNGGVIDGVDANNLECRVVLSEENLFLNPSGAILKDSGWQDCKDATTTYSTSFSSLTSGNTYYYQVQSRDNTPGPLNKGLSPYSDPIFLVQDSGGTTPPPGGGGGGAGGRPPEDDPDPDPVCGNGTLETGEQCDDGNTISGDGCSATCDIEHEAPEEQVCGNGTLEEGEECDDGNTISGDGCDAVCMLEDESVCGNGTLEEPEECDDGNLINGDGCSDTCELEVVPVTFEIKGKPEFRVEQATHPNLSLNSEFLVHKPSIANTDSVQIKLDDFGEATYEGEIITGTYDFGLNGEAHNTKVIRGIEITSETQVVTLDFTYADTAALIAGDTVDNNYINGVDMSKLIQQYRMEGTEVLSDLNKEGYVNGIDASIIITNYRKQGESF